MDTNKQVYTSKIGWGCVGIMALTLGGTFVLMLVEQLWMMALINIIVGAVTLHAMRTTRYVIEGKILHVKSGVLFNQSVDLTTVRRIEATRSWVNMSAPAWSGDRLEIFYNRYDSIIISPKEQESFINALLRINANIEVKMPVAAGEKMQKSGV